MAIEFSNGFNAIGFTRPTPTPTPTISVTPTVTPTITITPSVTPTVSLTPTNTIIPTVTNTPEVSVTPTSTPTISITPTNTVTPSVTPTITDTPATSVTPTQTPTITLTPTITDTPAVSTTPTQTPTNTITPTITVTPTITPTAGNIVSSGLMFDLRTAPSSGTSWTDNSGNGRNATLQGTPTYVSNNGGGIRLNNATYGGNDYISVPYNINGSTITIEIVASFNPTSNWATIWGNDTYNSSAGYFAYMGSSTNITWGKVPGVVASTITASNSIRHWVWVVNSTQHSLYLNGTQLGITATSSPAQTLFTANNFYFGARHTNAGTGATDKMNNSNASNYPVFYQMRVYNRALSTGEISTNFNSIRGTYGL